MKIMVTSSSSSIFSLIDSFLLDRTAQEVAKLTYKDMLELLTMKSQWRRDMERMLAERAMSEGESTEEDSGSDDSSTSSSQPLYNVQEICI